MSGPSPMNAKETIAKVADILRNEGWVQIHMNGPRGSCLMGAVHKAKLDPESERLCIDELYARCGVPMLDEPNPEGPDHDLVERYRKITAIIRFNDDPRTKLKDVMAILQ